MIYTWKGKHRTISEVMNISYSQLPQIVYVQNITTTPKPDISMVQEYMWDIYLHEQKMTLKSTEYKNNMSTSRRTELFR